MGFRISPDAPSARASENVIAVLGIAAKAHYGPERFDQ